jgi:hypothetical protein
MARCCHDADFLARYRQNCSFSANNSSVLRETPGHFGARRGSNPAAFRRFQGAKRSIAQAVLDVGARLDDGPRALVQISLHVLRGRIWRLPGRDIANHHLKLRMTFHKLIDCLSEAIIFVVQICCHGRFLSRG